MTILWTALVVAAFLAHVVAHEAAHAHALHRLGGTLRAAGLGIPLQPCLRVRPRGRRTWTLTLSPWLLGAYVEPTDDSLTLLDTKPYRDRAWFAGAGVITNAVTGFALLAAYGILEQRWLLTAITTSLAIAIFVARRAVTAYLLPPIGVASVAVLVYSLATTPVSEAQGIVGTVQVLHASTGADALLLVAVLGLALALLNCVPLYPLDGGRVVDAALRGRVSPRALGRYRAFTGLAVVALLGYTLLTDAWSLIA